MFCAEQPSHTLGEWAQRSSQYHPLSPADGGIIRKVINPCSAVLEAVYSKAGRQCPAYLARVGVEITPGAICNVGPKSEKVICLWEGNSLCGRMQTGAKCRLGPRCHPLDSLQGITWTSPVDTILGVESWWESCPACAHRAPLPLGPASSRCGAQGSVREW